MPHPPTAARIEIVDAVLRVTFDRPETLNALDPGTVSAVADAIETAGQDPAIRAVVLTGAGRAFSSGADLRADREKEPDEGDLVENLNRLVLALREVPKPVIAGVNGTAAGAGASLALAADLVLARESAYFLLAFAGIGLMPDAGATALVPAAAGRIRATRMAMLSERVDARTAYGWGLVTRVVGDDTFSSELDALVARVAAGPTDAYARTKEAFNRTTLEPLRDALEFELVNQHKLLAAEDFAEGVRAFREARPPRFTGQ